VWIIVDIVLQVQIARVQVQFQVVQIHVMMVFDGQVVVVEVVLQIVELVHQIQLVLDVLMVIFYYQDLVVNVITHARLAQHHSRTDALVAMMDFFFHQIHAINVGQTVEHVLQTQSVHFVITIIMYKIIHVKVVDRTILDVWFVQIRDVEFVRINTF